jgi:two-component system, OmpR family, alkaline phosphatase synthesis response regulator PhoP
LNLFSKALLVEDETQLARTLSIALRKLEIPTEHATTLKDAQGFLAGGPDHYDLIILDRQLPDGEGLTLCKKLRDQGYEGTVLVLTAKGETEDRVLGLNQGADDYLGKPFSWEELEARIRALSRRRKRTSISSIWEMDAQRLRVFGPQGWIELTPLEFKLASKLISAKGAIISRDSLLKDVWGFSFLPKTRTVDHFLGRLRKYFEENPEKPKHFLTVRGAGYRFES